MVTEDGRVVLAINGEVYNYPELRDRFDLDTPRLRSRTDSEVVLRLLARQGIAQGLPLLDGMFALAAWDQGTQRLHLARDAFGIKPLFHTEHRGVVWFASEIKPLLLIPGFSRRPSMEALHHFLSFDYIPGALTAFQDIHELRPGHTLVIDTQAQTIDISQFIHLQGQTDSEIDFHTAKSTTRQLLKDAVQRQLVSDVPVGVMLSGGVDSSALVGLTAELRGDADFHTYGIGFDAPSFDESKDAQRVAEHFGTHHHEVRVSAEHVRTLLPKALAHIDEPYADGSAIPTMMLASEASKEVTVLLSGEGGDELFAGYDTHAAAVARRRYRWLPRPIRTGLISPLVGMLPVSHAKLSFEFKAKRFVRGAELGLAESHHAWRAVMTEEAKRDILLDPDQTAALAPSDELFRQALQACQSDDPLTGLLHIDRSFHLPDDLMVKNDRMTMAHSIEARVPFCDLALARFLAKVPTRHLMRGLSTKVLLREAMADLLPAATCKKKKMGLEMPYSAWLRDELQDLARDVLSPQRVSGTGLFKAEAVTRLLDEHTDMKVDHGRALWGLVAFMMWHQMYIESSDWQSHTVPARAAR